MCWCIVRERRAGACAGELGAQRGQAHVSVRTWLGAVDVAAWYAAVAAVAEESAVVVVVPGCTLGAARMSLYQAHRLGCRKSMYTAAEDLIQLAYDRAVHPPTCKMTLGWSTCTQSCSSQERGSRQGGLSRTCVVRDVELADDGQV